MTLNPTTDNNQGKYEVPEAHCGDLAQIGNHNIQDLCQKNPDLLIFPQSFGIYHDDIEESSVFVLQGKTLTTHNIMGFVGCNNTQLTISSRFAKDDPNDYFLHYMLQKVFSINIFNFSQRPGKDNIWNFLLYLFPYYLKKAFAQGIYKAYIKSQYNNSNVKGSIDINRHLRLNIPFKGNIAYNLREYSENNPLTQLIRHTIEFINVNPYGKGLLTSDAQTREITHKIYQITGSTYKQNERQKVIAENAKQISHPYFTEYRILQNICLRILKHHKITFGEKNDKIYGLLFDGAWLWEEYLNTLLKHEFIHPENKTHEHKNFLFENFQTIYPDFISKQQPTIVGDAKYMPLTYKKYNEDSEQAISVYYKTITYMYRFNANYGLLLFPDPDHFDATYKIKDTVGSIRKLGLAIPQKADNFISFKTQMLRNEQDLMTDIRSCLTETRV